MKRLVLTTAIMIGSLSVFANTTRTTHLNPIQSNVVMVDNFKEISINKLPTAVTNAVRDDFKTATISKAYLNSTGQYKLDLNVEGNAKVVYATKDGKWIDRDDINEFDD